MIMTLKASSSKGGLSKAGKEAMGAKAPQRSQSVHNMIKPEVESEVPLMQELNPRVLQPLVKSSDPPLQEKKATNRRKGT